MVCAIAVWAGVLAGAQLGGTSAGLVLIAALALVAALALALAPRALRDRAGTVALCVALVAVGLARGAGHRACLVRSRAAAGSLATPGWVDARLVSPPERAAGEPQAIVAIDAAAAPLPYGTRISLRLPEGCPLEWGDRARILMSADPPSGVRNPGGFDLATSADAAAITGYGRAYGALPLSAHTWFEHWPSLTGMRARRAIERSLAAHLDTAACALAIPLITGDRSLLPPDEAAEQRASGLVHLLALSGLQVAWLAAIVRGVCASAGGGPRARVIAGATCAAFYVALAGPVPSLLRTSASELLSAGARLLGRALDPLQALALAVLALLAVAPGMALDLGFQLSCAATVGLVALAPPAHAWAGIGRPLAWIGPTCAAQIAAAPILIHRMHALSWAGPIANLVAVPVSGLLLTAAWLAVLVEALLPGAGHPLFGACDVLAIALERWTAWMARVPHALLPAGREPGIAIVAALGALLLALAAGRRRALLARREGPSPVAFGAALTGGTLVALGLALLLTVHPLVPPPGRAWVITLDVGQGDATAIGFADGWWIVDAGPRSLHRDAGEAVVLPFVRWAGVGRVRALVLTHDDGDHTGGARALLRGLAVARVLAAPALDGAAGPGARFGASAIARGDVLHRAPTMIVRWPPRWEPGWSPAQSLTSPDNAAGVVLEVGDGRGRALLLADVDSLIEQRLTVAPGIAMLHVGHHGSASSTGAGFLARMRPRRAAISVGARNRYGHPAPAVLERLVAAGVPVLRTDRDGAVWIELSEGGARLVDWRHGEPFASASRACVVPTPRE